MYGLRRNSNDKILTVAAILAAAYGLLLVSSATRSNGTKSLMIVQCVAIAIGLVLMVFLVKTDYSIFLELSSIVFGLYVFLLIVVLFIGIGRSQTGTMGWISLGPVNIQPSEFAKIGFIITFSYHLEKIGNKINKFTIFIFHKFHSTWTFCRSFKLTNIIIIFFFDKSLSFDTRNKTSFSFSWNHNKTRCWFHC